MKRGVEMARVRPMSGRTEARQRRQERGCIRELMDGWRSTEEMLPEVAAFIALTVARAADTAALAGAMARLMQQETGAVRGAVHWQEWVRRTDEWEDWLWDAALGSRLLGLRIALEAWLRSERGGKPDPACAAVVVDGWRSLEQATSEVARELLCGLLAGVDRETVVKVLTRAAPAWRPELDDQKNSWIWEGSEWVDGIAREEPLLAIKIGVEAALRYDLDNDVVVREVDVLECWPVPRAGVLIYLR